MLQLINRMTCNNEVHYGKMCTTVSILKKVKHLIINHVRYNILTTLNLQLNFIKRYFLQWGTEEVKQLTQRTYLMGALLD
jgi:hypothetical protein